MRLGGVVCSAAIIAVVMPQSWHARMHALLGLGEFPAEPIAEYLARGMSGMCALYGMLQVWLARDVRRHRGIIAFQAVALMGIALLATLAMRDIGMPLWWIWGDVASVWAYGLGILALQKFSPPTAENVAK